MLTYDLSLRENTPLYIYLYNRIKEDILKGNILPDEQLPSKRALAKHLNISVITVENAYSQLMIEGYIYSVEAKGYFACRLDNSTCYVPAVKYNFANEQEHEYYADFIANKICRNHFPFSIWSKLMREVLSSQDMTLLQTVPYNGMNSLRTAISEHLLRFRGMNVSPDQIIIGAGTEYLYNRLIQLLDSDSIYAMEDPGYKRISNIYKAYNGKWVSIPIDDSGISIDALEKSGANVVHVSPAHHFPTGIIMPMKRRQELLKWANARKNRYIIEDDYDCEFRYSGKPIPPMQTSDIHDRIIYMNTFSKTLVPSIRISYMVLPRTLMDKYISTMNFYSCSVSSFEQCCLAKFISEGYFERHINRMKNHYKKHRDLIINAINNSSLKERATILEANAGTHLLLKIDTSLSDETAMELARKKDINISCMSAYCFTPDSRRDHTFIINYSGIEATHIDEAVRRLAEVFL